ncbi:uncharacterized protein B4U80_05345, partial [Leptotrombidium deliense]
ALFAASNCMKIVKFEVPRSVVEGSDVDLLCKYDLQGNSIYSVKWFYNYVEFYRYLPKSGQNSPRVTVNPFNFRGLILDLSKSNNEKVHLLNVSEGMSGIYRCEVSGEFSEDSKQGTMHVTKDLIGIESLKNQTVLNGNVARFTCIASEMTNVTFEWRRNGKELKGFRNLVINIANGSILRIGPVYSSDSGTVECIAKDNEGHEVTMSAALKVIEGNAKVLR